MKRKHNYVCGYKGDKHVAYGKSYSYEHENTITKGCYMWVDPMTLLQAKAYAKKMNEQFGLEGKDRMVVFELKEVK